MITSNIFDMRNFHTADYAKLSESNGILTIRILKTPYKGDRHLALKDVKYCVIDGILYVTATVIDFKHLSDFRAITLMSSRIVYEISDKELEELEDPPVLGPIVIHRWLRKNKTVHGFELNRGDEIEYYKLKKETPARYAISNFILVENDIA